MPALSADAPAYYYSIAESERLGRCDLNSDLCVIDEEFYFVRCNLRIPVQGLSEEFMWGVWVSLSRQNFADYLDNFENPDRATYGPYFGWLSADIGVYPDTQNLKVMVHPQEPDVRPQVEMEPTDHPLAIEQRNGITLDRLTEIYTEYLH